MTISLSDKGTLTLNGQVMSDTVAGDAYILTPVNPATSRIKGSNGTSVSQRVDRDVHTLTMNIMANSPTDIWLKSRKKESPSVIFEGSYKRSYIINGTEGVESWSLEGGSFTTQPTRTINDTDGNALKQYMIEFDKAVEN